MAFQSSKGAVARFYAALVLLVLGSVMLISTLHDELTLEPNVLHPAEAALLPALFASAERGDRITPLTMQRYRRADVALPDDVAQQLAAGQTVALQNEQGDLLFYRGAGADEVLAIGPVPYRDTTEPRQWWLDALPYGLLALAMALFCWPLLRDIAAFQRFCQQVGAGHYPASLTVTSGSLLRSVATTLVAMSDKLRVQQQQQREFLNAISHDFLTPLARLRFSVTNARLMPHTELPLDSISDDLHQLEQLVDEFLSHAELSHYRPLLQYSQFDAGAVVLASYQRVLPLSPHQPALEFEPPQHLWYWHAGCFQRIAQNLIGNAVRYAHRRVKVRVTAAGELWVEDDGPGFAESALPQLLHAFEQGEVATAQLYQGKGLGLSSVAMLCRYAGAQLTLSRSASLGGALVKVQCYPPSST